MGLEPFRAGREEEKEREILLVLAIFAATIAYVAGLNPPGGFSRSSQGGHTAGDPVLQADHPRRYKAFFFLNTTAFVASLLAIFVIVRYHHELQENLRGRRLRVVAQLYGPIIAALLGLGGAYAAGSCRDSKHTAYVFLGVVFPVVACICLMELRLAGRIYGSLVNQIKLIPGWIYERLVKQLNKLMMKTSQIENLEKTREYIQLLAVLAATIAYQAGLDPPGGVWSAIGEGHNVGDPILLTTHPARYKVFFYSNSSAFVASLVIMVMLQNEKLVRGHAVRAAMILDLFGLMGAYAAGSCRDTSTSIYTVAMAGAVLVYVVIHIVFFTLDSKSTAARLEKKREVLLLLAILAATLTYQAGLTPPGGVWEEDDGKLGRRAGFPVLQDRSPRRYKAFFYCNGASFMASVALIVLLLNQNLYLPGIQCYALVVCMVAGLFGLMGAYAAGSSLHLRTSIFVLVLMALVFLILVGLSIEMVIRHYRPRGGGGGRGGKASDDDDHPPSSSEEAMKPMYLMLVGILGASLTYMAGLKPPGGMWREDDGNGHSAGNPVLYDINKRRYNVFFYSNSISFVASITIIGFLLCRMMRGGKMHLAPLHTAMLLDLLALLGAYAAGSDRQMRRSLKVLVILPIVMVVVGAFYFVSGKAASPTSQTDAAAAADTSNGGSATTTTQQDTIHPLQSSV
ncbi:hypothetical protein BS78_K044500 [Paspalum vaginatum]|uniref:PGG domain-containing protein n=1 Tax=Paspalum vaginatum TaxID=158149 RepID=A0A9W7XCY7_9POAL|nr:hypothetical protein BS78_K044500 [Paspalum vaginatum]